MGVLGQSQGRDSNTYRVSAKVSLALAARGLTVLPRQPPSPAPGGLSALLPLQELLERLQGIVTRPQRLRPAQNSKVRGGAGWGGRGGAGGGEEAASPAGPAAQIASDYRAEFARCLEPLLLLGPRRAPGVGAAPNT